MATANPLQNRSAVLKPYLEKLSALDQLPDSGRPYRINIGAKHLQLEPWERDAILASLQEGSDAGDSLLADGVALQAKSLAGLKKLEGDEPPSAEEVQGIHSTLQLDAALGFFLMAELQKQIDQLILGGNLERAKKLTRYRHKLNRSVSGLKDFIGEAALEQAETLATGLAEQPEPSRQARGNAEPSEDVEALLKLEQELNLQQEQPPDWNVEPPLPAHLQIQTKEPPRSWGKPLAGVLGLVIAVWIVLVGWPTATNQPIPEFALTDFQGVPAIRQVAARPPSLFVQVDSQAWRELNDAERQQVVHSVSEIISPAGYRGALFTNAQGKTVAQWLRETGIRLR